MTVSERLDRLRRILQDNVEPGHLERLGAALIGRLLGVTISVARSGFQHGGDAGPSGRQGRRFRIEAKRYSDTTALSERELLGELDHASMRDRAIEAWLLVATRDVHEQLDGSLALHGELLGIPVVVIDWKTVGFPALAALCASAPDLVGQFANAEAELLCWGFGATAADAIATLRRDLQAWSLGFEATRAAATAHLQRLWSTPVASRAALGQDAAGGARAHRIRRASVDTALSRWWDGAARTDGAPAVLVGREGVGKTWASLGWVTERSAALPIVLVTPASAFAAADVGSLGALKRFVAARLHEFTQVRDLEHWQRRLDRMLLRPTDEGPVLMLVVDGLNQVPAVDWTGILRLLQHDSLAGRVSVMATTREHHLRTLSWLRGLALPPAIVEVSDYDLSPGGELDQMLDFENLRRGELHPDLVPLASNPRLFSLVLRFRERLVEAGRVTVHRLLWEYGRDTLGVRAGVSFSEEEWRAWLLEVAERHREGIRRYNLRTLGETAARPDLGATAVSVRLGDLIDGGFLTHAPSGQFALAGHAIAHALGGALLARLDELPFPTYEATEIELQAWLDPIEALDERAEILRAAVSILVERDGARPSGLASALVTAWLLAQNLPEGHRKDVARLADQIVDPLLDLIERSGGEASRSARMCAVNGIRAVPKNDVGALATIVVRAGGWLATVSREVGYASKGGNDFAEVRAKRLREYAGVERSGTSVIQGVPIRFVDHLTNRLGSLVPSLLENFPLVPAVPALHSAVLAMAICGESDAWDGLRWLCLLNEVDGPEATEALRALSARIAALAPAPGQSPDLQPRVAALLLWLTGEERDEQAAAALDRQTKRFRTYEDDYLADPGKSLFPLERRHAASVLADERLSLYERVRRAEAHLLDPSFEVPVALEADLRGKLSTFDVAQLGAHVAPGPADISLRHHQPALARCAPDLLADIARRRMHGYAERPLDARHWSAVHAGDGMILVDQGASVSFAALRLRGVDPDGNQEMFARNQFLAVEILGQPAASQVATVIEADPELVLTDLDVVLRQLDAGEVDALVDSHGSGSPRAAKTLVALLLCQRGPFGDRAWEWLLARALDQACEHRGTACQVLAQVDAVRFGRDLVRSGWSWSASDERWSTHFRSVALVAATGNLSFDEVAGRLAPWCVLYAARVRGGRRDEVVRAACLIGRFVMAEHVTVADLGAVLETDRANGTSTPAVFSINNEPDGDEAIPVGRPVPEGTLVGQRRKAAETVVDRVRKAWEDGAELYLANVDPADMAMVVGCAGDLVDAWIDGSGDLTPDFQRRVRRAEGVYLALCEALLTAAPEKGAALWRALRRTLRISFRGIGDVDEMVHVAFRAPPSDASERLMQDLLDLGHASTDEKLLDLAIAAAANGRRGWLQTVVDRDLRSPRAWVRARGKVLAGYTVGNDASIPEAWPDGEVSTSSDELRFGSSRNRHLEGAARHWWCQYLRSPDPVAAHAAWILFTSTADRRAWVWMEEDLEAPPVDDEARRIRRVHLEYNKRALKRGNKRDEKLSGRFLGRKTVVGIGPWGKVLA